MSSSNVNSEFAEFGNRMYLIAIFTLISFILGIANWFWNGASGINVFVGLLIFIFFLLILSDIKKAGTMLNNRNLLEFRSKFITSYILTIIGAIVMATGGVALFAMILYGISSTILFIAVLVLVIIGIIILLVGAILKIQAWGNLETFFTLNMTLFPQNIANNAKEGSHYCKIGAILDITIILSFIGDLLRVIGYFKLATLKDLKEAPAQPAISQQPPTPKAGSKFCPSCGSPITQGGRYCPSCGAEIT